MEALAHICDFKPAVHDDVGNLCQNESVYQLIQDMAPSFSDTLFYWGWKEKEFRCSEHFQTIFSKEGRDK